MPLSLLLLLSNWNSWFKEIETVGHFSCVIEGDFLEGTSFNCIESECIIQTAKTNYIAGFVEFDWELMNFFTFQGFQLM